MFGHAQKVHINALFMVLFFDFFGNVFLNVIAATFNVLLRRHPAISIRQWEIS